MSWTVIANGQNSINGSSLRVQKGPETSLAISLPQLLFFLPSLDLFLTCRWLPSPSSLRSPHYEKVWALGVSIKDQRRAVSFFRGLCTDVASSFILGVGSRLSALGSQLSSFWEQRYGAVRKRGEKWNKIGCINRKEEWMNMSRDQ